MDRVCLITPPSPFLLDERVFMSLGILRVAAALEAAGQQVEVLDLSGVENYLDAARDHAVGTDARVFGITATTPQLPAAVKLGREIRRARPDARLVLGGPHVTLTQAAARREAALGVAGRATRAMRALDDTFDVVVAGDGERAIFVAASDAPPPLVDADDPKSALFLQGAALARLPFPARHLVDVGSYHYTIDGARALSLIAQLGCPFECGFCGGRASPSFRRVRMRPTDDVLAEIAHLHDVYGATGFMFYDDELNVNKGIVGLMRGIRQLQDDRGVEFRLRGFVKAELFDDEQAELMFEAGFRWVLTGFESGAPQILRNINKKATREDNTRCVDTARRHGLKVKALMSIGHPGESPVTVDPTRRWLIDVAPDDFDVTIITTYPGSPYYDRAVCTDEAAGVWTYEVCGDRLHTLELDYTATADYYKGHPEGGLHGVRLHRRAEPRGPRCAARRGGARRARPARHPVQPRRAGDPLRALDGPAPPATEHPPADGGRAGDRPGVRGAAGRRRARRRFGRRRAAALRAVHAVSGRDDPAARPHPALQRAGRGAPAARGRRHAAAAAGRRHRDAGGPPDSAGSGPWTPGSSSAAWIRRRRSSCGARCRK